MLDNLDAGAVRRWSAAALEGLRRHQREIDALNVFPVADADTGTNLVLTFQAATTAVATGSDTTPSSGPEVFTRMARGALLGARGNSGMIVSQLLAGAASALPPDQPIRGRVLADALRAAVVASYSAVARPVEGTVLSVARAAAAGATDADSDDLGAVSSAATKAAVLALESTPAQLASMGLPSVVDAGGRGLVVVLDALDTVVRDRVILGPAMAQRDPISRSPGTQRGWEIQYLVSMSAEFGGGIARLRERLTAIGDSVVVASADPPGGTGSVWTVHVHSHDIGAAIEAALDVGRPHQIVVTPLMDYAGRAVAQAPRRGRGVVAVVSGPGLARTFMAEGAVTLEVAHPALPTVAELLTAVERTGVSEVVLLANDHAHAEIADAVALAADRHTVSVLHTRSPVQGIAALAVADSRRPFRDDVIAMAEAAAATRWAEVLVAQEAAYTLAGPCVAGAVLTLVDGDVVGVESDVLTAARNLLDRLLNAGGELVTLVLGADATANLGDDLREHLRERWPFSEGQVFDGGQRSAVLLVGVE